MAEPTPRLTRDELASAAVLERVDLDGIWDALARSEVLQLAPGDLLIPAGQENHRAYIVLKGMLAVRIGAVDTEPIAWLERGELVGEMSLIDGQVPTASVHAAAPTRVLAMNEQTFWRLVMASHDFAINLLILLTQRVRSGHTNLDQARQIRARLERQASLDGLTNLYNRRWLDENLLRLIARCEHSQGTLSIVMIDIDHFKRFNDQFGHIAGDMVLRAVAGQLQASVRPGDFAARYGGEEMTLMLPDTPLAGAVVAAERLRVRIAALSVTGPAGEALPTVTVSLGVATWRLGEAMASLVDRADDALYRAKHAGRDRVEPDQ